MVGLLRGLGIVPPKKEERFLSDPDGDENWWGEGPTDDGSIWVQLPGKKSGPATTTTTDTTTTEISKEEKGSLAVAKQLYALFKQGAPQQPEETNNTPKAFTIAESTALKLGTKKHCSELAQAKSIVEVEETLEALRKPQLTKLAEALEVPTKTLSKFKTRGAQTPTEEFVAAVKVKVEQMLKEATA